MADISVSATKTNTCPICFTEGLKWHPDPNKCEVEVFQCKHFACKTCTKILRSNFTCPCCRKNGIPVADRFLLPKVHKNKWITLSDWIAEFSIYFDTKQKWDKWAFGKIYLDLIKEYKMSLRVKQPIQPKKIKPKTEPQNM